MSEDKKTKKIKKADPKKEAMKLSSAKFHIGTYHSAWRYPKKEAMKLSIAELREVMILKLNEEIEKLDESDNTKSILLSYLARILKF